MKLIDLIVGARPNFMKVAPIIHAIESYGSSKLDFEYRLIHTGQHYDEKLSDTFFEQLNIPQPDVNLGVGSGSQAKQTALIMTRYEKVLLKNKADMTLVFGDVNSTMACSITAQKLGVKVAHVEAGIRSNDWSMPEEINRLVTDAISNWFFTTSENANNTLINSGVSKDRIFFVGNTMIDTLYANLDKLKIPSFYDKYKLNFQKYFVMTLHRPSNVDEFEKLSVILKAIGDNTHKLPVIFPVHPRTSKLISNMEYVPDNIHLVDPQPYLEFNYLVKNAMAVITDSGGITEESTVLGVPCMTLRDSTERPETVTVGTNQLLGTDPSALEPALNKLFDGKWQKGSIPEKWDGKTAQRIVSILENLFCN